MKNDKVLNRRQSKGMLYQVSLLQGLTNGDYQGSVALGELKEHGDIGIGTFDRLNGELIMLDGEIYRVAGDGSVNAVSDNETTPFTMVAFMDSDEVIDLAEIPSYDTLCNELNRIVEARGKNRFYIIRIDGIFQTVSVRSVYAQNEPYQRLTKVLEHDQTFFNYEMIEGTMVGVYCPPYMTALNAPGWHLHFVSKDKTKGGHVLGLNLADAVLTWHDLNSFQVRLPQNKAFSGFDLMVDQSEDIRKIETNQ